MTKLLVITTNTSDVDQGRLRSALDVKVEIAVNSMPNTDDAVAIFDLKHEGTVDDRWPEQVIVVGDTLSKFKQRASAIVEKSQALDTILSVLEEESDEDDSGPLEVKP